MHAEVLLNPFYQADYVIEDDGTNHSIFSQMVEEEEHNKNNINKMDAVEDILLDDFSQGSSDDLEGEDIAQRTSSAVSVDSNNSFNIRRTKGKQHLVNHSNTCLETLAIKIDQLIIDFEDKIGAGQTNYNQVPQSPAMMGYGQ